MKRITFQTAILCAFLSVRAVAQVFTNQVLTNWPIAAGGDNSSSCLSLAPNGTLYVARHKNAGGGSLLAINPLTVTTNWTLSFTTRNGPLNTPAIGNDGTIYVGTDLGQFSALNPTNGATRWAFYDSQQQSAGIQASPAIGADGTVYVALWTNVYALTNTTALTNSTPKWTFSYPANDPDIFYLANSANLAAYSSPAAGMDGTIYVNSQWGQLLALNSTNGALKWATVLLDYSFYFGPGGGSSPAIAADGTVYFGFANNFFAVNPADGSFRWYFQASDDDAFQFSPVIGEDGTVYAEVVGYSAPDRLLAFNPDGSVKWTNSLAALQTSKTRFQQSSCAIASGGQVYFSDTDGTLYGFKADGTTNWMCQTFTGPLNAPLIAPNGTIYVEAYDTASPCVYAIAGSAPVACSLWPEYGKNARHTASMALAAVGSPAKTGNAFQFTVSGSNNLPACLCASTNLVSWTNIAQVVLTGGSTNFVDTQMSSFQKRFYRVMPQ